MAQPQPDPRSERDQHEHPLHRNLSAGRDKPSHIRWNYSVEISQRETLRTFNAAARIEIGSSLQYCGVEGVELADIAEEQALSPLQN